VDGQARPTSTQGLWIASSLGFFFTSNATSVSFLKMTLLKTRHAENHTIASAADGWTGGWVYSMLSWPTGLQYSPRGFGPLDAFILKMTLLKTRGAKNHVIASGADGWMLYALLPYIPGAFGPPVAFANLKPCFLRSGPVAQCRSYPSGHWAIIILAGFLAPFPRLMFTVVAFLFFVGVHFFRF